ncbi:MAG: hypothetical protein V2J10_05365, partial [Wenzhouxiangella sp.]|nr:hypothetical protein [Wenzhouxiangella sp.]
MRALLALLLTVAANLAVSAADAAESDPTWYRVEVIVMTHEGGRSDAFPVATLDDFRALIDPLDRAATAASTNDDSDGDPDDDSNGGEDEESEAATDDPR